MQKLFALELLKIRGAATLSPEFRQVEEKEKEERTMELYREFCHENSGGERVNDISSTLAWPGSYCIHLST